MTFCMPWQCVWIQTIRVGMESKCCKSVPWQVDSIGWWEQPQHSVGPTENVSAFKRTLWQLREHKKNSLPCRDLRWFHKLTSLSATRFKERDGTTSGSPAVSADCVQLQQRSVTRSIRKSNNFDGLYAQSATHQWCSTLELPNKKAKCNSTVNNKWIQEQHLLLQVWMEKKRSCDPRQIWKRVCWQCGKGWMF